jgi:hypothetical protein
MNKDDDILKELQLQLEIMVRRQIEKEKDLITEYSGELHKGDLIIISETNIAYLGFYLRRGQGGSMQYFGVSQLINWFENKTDPRFNTKKGGPAACYMNSPHPNRVSKYSPDLLTEFWKRRYDIAIEALKLLKIVKE